VYKKEDAFTTMEAEDQNKIILALQGKQKARTSLVRIRTTSMIPIIIFAKFPFRRTVYVREILFLLLNSCLLVA
jgi:hypothetical protein